MSRSLSIAAWMAVAVMAAGCRSTRSVVRGPIHSYESDALGTVRTVGVVPFAGQMAPKRACEDIAEAFIAELQRLGQFRAVAVRDDAGRLTGLPKLEQGPPLSLDGLIQAHRRLGLDGIIVGRITHYQPYGEPVLGLNLEMLSCKTGQVDWWTSAVFDSSRPNVLERLKQYCRSEQIEGSGPKRWRQVLASPRGYAQFVSHEIVATLARH